MTARLRLLYFLHHAGLGVFLPFFSLYLRSQGLTDRQIGSTQLVGALLAGPASVFWSRWGRSRGGPTRALRVVALLAAPMVLLPFASTPNEFAVLLMVHGVSVGAMAPLIDASVSGWARSQRGVSYSRLRAFGSLGFVVAALGVGFALTAYAMRPVFLATLLASVGLASLVSWTLAKFPDQGSLERQGEVWAVMKDRRVVAALLVCVIHSASCIPYYRMFGLLVAARGLPVSTVGLAMGVGVIAESLAFWALPALLKRVPRTVLLWLCFAVTGARWALMAFVTSLVPLLALQVLQGVTFALFWGTMLQLVGRVVSARIRGTVIVVVGAVTFAGGDAVGLAWVSALAPALGTANLFLVAAALEALPLAGSVLLYFWTDSAHARRQAIVDAYGDETTRTDVA